MARPFIVLTAVLWLGCGGDGSGDGVLLRGPEINSRMQWVGLTSSSVGRALSHKTIWSCILFSDAVWIVLDIFRFAKKVRITVWTLKTKSKSTTDSRSVRMLRPRGAHVQGAFTSESDNCNLMRLGGYCLSRGRACLVFSVMVFAKYTYLKHCAEFFNIKPSGTQINHGALEVSSKNFFFCTRYAVLHCLNQRFI
jgi:hypothetical protein